MRWEWFIRSLRIYYNNTSFKCGILISNEFNQSRRQGRVRNIFEENLEKVGNISGSLMKNSRISTGCSVLAGE